MPPAVTKQTLTTKSTIRTSPSGSVIDRIAPIDFNQDEGIKMLVYGESGTGKTTFWSSFPGPILAVICSGGNRPGELRSVDTPDNRKKISQVALRESSELKTLIEHLSTTSQFKTVVLDHTSGLQDLIMKELLGLDEIPAQKSFGMASQQTYGQCTQMMKEYLRAMLGLSINVVLVAQQRTFGGKDDGMDPELIKPTVGAGLVPSLTGWVNSSCDYCVNTFVQPKFVDRVSKIAGKDVTTRVKEKGVEFALRTGKHEIYYTKFRLPLGNVLPDSIVNPTYDKVMTLIKGKKPTTK
jgi:hypothetical protein